MFNSSGVVTMHEQLFPDDAQDQELAFVQHGAEAERIRTASVLLIRFGAA